MPSGGAFPYRIEDVTEIPQVPAHQFDAVGDFVQALGRITDIKNSDFSFAAVEQEARQFGADETRATSYQCCHLYLAIERDWVGRKADFFGRPTPLRKTLSGNFFSCPHGDANCSVWPLGKT